MTAAWKLTAEARMMEASCPAVLSTSTVHMLATSGIAEPPSRPTLHRWMKDLIESKKLRPVIKGVYLNRLGHRDVSAAAAAQWVRARSVVSLTWVLEQAGITNNFGDTITCVIPTEPSWPSPQISDRRTEAGTFRFFAMPARLVDDQLGDLKEIRDFRYDYPRATSEKALLDWIYLGASPRSRMTRPPLDLQIEALNRKRLTRVARAMGIEALLEAWLDDYGSYQGAEDVRENSSSVMRF